MVQNISFSIFLTANYHVSHHHTSYIKKWPSYQNVFNSLYNPSFNAITASHSIISEYCVNTHKANSKRVNKRAERDEVEEATKVDGHGWKQCCRCGSISLKLMRDGQDG